MTDETFEGWAVVEIMGHRKRAGFAKEVQMAGGQLLRIDIPTADGDVTEFYGANAIFALRPVTEDVARAAVESYHMDPRPVRPAGFRIEDHSQPELYDDEEDPY